ncbi:MAG: YncE family protein [bacterium]|nr:YncE family protein [bacterium]
MKDKSKNIQAIIYGGLLILIALSFPLWAMKKPTGILDERILGNNDLLYFATDAPDNFIIYSPGLHENRLIRPASERMADMVINNDGNVVWTATKSGYVDRYEINVDQNILTTPAVDHTRIAPVLAAIALSADQRFIAVGYGNSEDYNSRSVKILPSDSISLADELADFAVSGDIQDIVANPVDNIFYIVNSHSDRVRIYNANRFRLESDIIELGNSPGSFVVRPDGLRAYGAMNARQAIAIVDLETNETIQYTSLGFPPYALAFNADGSHLYIASRDSSTVAVLDTNTNEIVSSFNLPPRLEGMMETNYSEMIAVSSNEQYLYVMPKRQELVIYDISPVASGGIPEMVQSEVFAAKPFFMDIRRNHTVPGVQ